MYALLLVSASAAAIALIDPSAHTVRYVRPKMAAQPPSLLSVVWILRRTQTLHLEHKLGRRGNHR